MAKVTFVLAAYKRRFLAEAIKSILAQTYTDFELVVVDDCSPDSLKEIVDQFDDGRVSYQRNAKNVGGRDLVAAWNHAMSFAKSEFAVIASDDDIYHPEYLAEMMRLVEKYPTCDVFHCRICMIDAEGKIVFVGGARGEYETPAEMLYNTGVQRIALRAPDVMFRRSRWEAEGGFFRSPRAWYSDIGSWILFSHENGAACSPRILFKWRDSGVNISSSHRDAREKIRAGFEFRDWLLKRISATKCLNEDDSLYLEMAKRGLDRSVFGIMEQVLLHVPFPLWWRVMRENRFQDAFRRLLIRDRIKYFLKGCR